MPRIPWRFLLLISLLLIGFLVVVQGTLAQDAYTAILSSPDTSDFPRLTALLDVHDPTGAFIHSLTLQSIILLEDDQQVPLTALQEQKPGVQFVIAVSTGDTFTIRDGMGISRYQYLLQGPLTGPWAEQPSGVDDFSLLTPAGPQVLHSPDPASVRSSMEFYIPADTVDPGLEVLSAALQVASDPFPRPGMERAVLFITPPQPTEVSLGLQSIIESANQLGIRIFVWLLAGQEEIVLPETDLLRNLATQTGASFSAFSGTETLPDLDSLLEPLRYIYLLQYDSLVSTSGSHTLAAQVTRAEETITTPPLTFDVNLQPPVLDLLPLPVEIVRSFFATPAPNLPSSESDLLPKEQLVSIQVTFPDGYERPLARTSLYIDGVLTAENTTSPFDQFVWDLSTYTQDGEHTLKVEALDDLGLTSATGESTVRITVPTTTQNIVSVFSQKRFILVGVLTLISGSVLVLVLILAGRIRPRLHPGQLSTLPGSTEKTRPVSYRDRVRLRKDPVTQPVRIAPAHARQAKPHVLAPGLLSWTDRLHWFKHREKPAPAFAHLLPLVNTGEPTLAAPLPINMNDVTLGRDPSQAALVIPDPSIEALHARIQVTGEQFTITDAGSVAGTWVNFNQVPVTGTLLQHTDIIHLGAVGFRFTLAHPGSGRKTVITILEPEQ